MTPTKKAKSSIECRAVVWRKRPGWLLANEQIALYCLRGGGHLASLSFRAGPAPNVNLLWEPSWQTIEPARYSKQKHGRRFGPPPAGKYLSRLAGHSLCLDYFGAPSEEEALLGLPLHGEVASAAGRWPRSAPNAAWGCLACAARRPVPDC